MGSSRPSLSFNGTNGANPTAAPVQGADGRFYGTTFRGGAVGAGTVFVMTAEGALTTLYSFAFEGDGGYPSGELVQAADGSFYGTTTAGGLSDCGTVFRITPSGAFATLHVFNGADGKFPSGALAQGCDGSFYGLTSEGGAYEQWHRVQDHSCRRIHYALLIYRRQRWLCTRRRARPRLGLQFLWRDKK